MQGVSCIFPRLREETRGCSASQGSYTCRAHLRFSRCAVCRCADRLALLRPRRPAQLPARSLCCGRVAVAILELEPDRGDKHSGSSGSDASAGRTTRIRTRTCEISDSETIERASLASSLCQDGGHLALNMQNRNAKFGTPPCDGIPIA